METAQPQDPYRAMLRGGGLPALVVGVVAVVVSAVLAGPHGIAGSLLATAVVVASFGSSLLAMSKTAKVAPHLVMVVALAAYTTKVGLLAVFLLVFGGADWLSGRAFSFTAVAVAMVWLAGELWAFTRVRTLVFADAESPGKLR